MQLCSKIVLPDCTTSRRNPAITRSVQYFSCSNLRILKCRNLPFFSVKYSDMKRMNNSVLDFSKNQSKRSKLLLQLKDQRLKGIIFSPVLPQHSELNARNTGLFT